MNKDAGALRLFIRDDDAGALTPELRAFAEVFERRNIPVSYQVIPEQLTEECAAFLRDRKADRPELYEFGQHGLSHEMEVRGRRVFYEFGPERSYEEQLQVIRRGRELLRERLGDAFDGRVFTPPRHRYDRNTLRALKASGVEILSASCYTGLPHRLAYGAGRVLGLSNLGRGGVSHHARVRPDSGLYELSIAVAVDDGVRKLEGPEDFVRQVEAARRHTGAVGLMFHHHAYRSAEDHAFLAALADRLKDIPGVSFHLLSALRPAGQAAAQGSFPARGRRALTNGLSTTR